MKKILISFAGPTALAAIVAAEPQLAHAAGIINNSDPSQIDLNSVVTVLTNVIHYMFAFVAAIAVIFIMISGYQYVLSAGNPEKVEKAKMGLTWSIGGFILAVSAFAIVDLVQSVLLSKHHVGQSYAGGHSGPQQAKDTVNQIASFLLAFAGTAGVLYLILGGYRYVTSQGNQDSIEKAKQTVLYSVIGLIVVFSSWVVFNTVHHVVIHH